MSSGSEHGSKLPDSVIASQAAPKRVARSRNFAARLFGYDVFISFALGPPPRGSFSYASDLARRLRERDFTVFFSEEEAPPGEQLDSTLTKALHSSRLLVVVANRGTLEEPRWVRKEVEEFRRHHPARPVIPISVGDALQDPGLARRAQPWLEFQDKIWLDESTDAAENGIASSALIERLATAPTRVRSNVSWRRVVRGVIAVLAALVVALGFFWKNARDSAERARAELRKSTAQRLTAQSLAMIRGETPGGHERALLQLLVAHRLGEPSVQLSSATLSALQATAGQVKMQDTGSSIFAVSASPLGDRVATGGIDGRLRVWDAHTGALLSTGAEVEAAIYAIAFSPDGQRIATAGADGRLRMWDAQSGKATFATPKARPEDFSPPITALAYTSGGTVIATGGQNTLRFWNASTGQLTHTEEVGPEGIPALAISSDGQHLVTGDATAVLLMERVRGEWVNQNLDRSNPDPNGTDGLSSVVFSPDEKLIVVGAPSGTVTFWDLASRRVIQRLQGHRGTVTSLAYTADGRQLLTGDEFGTLLWWDARTYRQLGKLLEGQQGSLSSLSAGPGAAQMVSGGVDGMLRLWDLRAATGLQILLGGASAKPHDLTSVAFESRPGSARLLSTHADGSVSLWDLQALPVNPKLLETRTAKQEDFTKSRAAFSPDGKNIAAGGDDQQLRIWNAASGRLICAQPQLLKDTRSLVYSADGAQVLTADLGPTVRRWSGVTGRLVDTLLAKHVAGITSVALAPQGRHLVVGKENGSVQLWDLTTAGVSPPQQANRTRDNPRAGFKDTGLSITALAFSTDGRRFVSGGKNGTLQLWSITPMKAVPGNLMQGHSQQVTSLALSPDGNSIVSGSYDRSVRLWDVPSGLPIGALYQSDDESVPVGVDYSADGRFIVAATTTGTILVWPGRIRWPELLCAKLARNLSHQQWKEWISPEIDYQKQCSSLQASN